MIHPKLWSLQNVYFKLWSMWNDTGAMSPEDVRAYSMLDVKDKIVLDVGAYNGDSAKLFLRRGAKKVICIEKDEESAKKIKLDNAEVIIESFCLEHLLIPHDCMKIDIEGYEAILLDYKGALKPSVAEVHGGYLVEKFIAMGFKVIGKPRPDMFGCLMKNFD